MRYPVKVTKLTTETGRFLELTTVYSRQTKQIKWYRVTACDSLTWNLTLRENARITPDEYRKKIHLAARVKVRLSFNDVVFE